MAEKRRLAKPQPECKHNWRPRPDISAHRFTCGVCFEPGYLTHAPDGTPRIVELQPGVVTSSNRFDADEDDNNDSVVPPYRMRKK